MPNYKQIIKSAKTESEQWIAVVQYIESNNFVFRDIPKKLREKALNYAIALYGLRHDLEEIALSYPNVLASCDVTTGTLLKLLDDPSASKLSIETVCQRFNVTNTVEGYIDFFCIMLEDKYNNGQAIQIMVDALSRLEPRWMEQYDTSTLARMLSKNLTALNIEYILNASFKGMLPWSDSYKEYVYPAWLLESIDINMFITKELVCDFISFKAIDPQKIVSYLKNYPDLLKHMYIPPKKETFFMVGPIKELIDLAKEVNPDLCSYLLEYGMTYKPHLYYCAYQEEMIINTIGINTMRQIYANSEESRLYNKYYAHELATGFFHADCPTGDCLDAISIADFMQHIHNITHNFSPLPLNTECEILIP